MYTSAAAQPSEAAERAELVRLGYMTLEGRLINLTVEHM
jgi:hypothetical protein